MSGLFSKIPVIFLLLVLTACVSVEDEREDTQIFTASRAKVWEALVQVFSSYKIQISDEEKGLIKTEVITGADVWTPAHDRDRDTSGISYTITARLIYEKPHATVIIKKDIKQEKGFLSSSQTPLSDFLEEGVLFYRLGRELHIKRLIKKYSR